MRTSWIVAAIIALVVIADQWLKIWVKTHFYMGEDMPLTSWFHLRFIENNGFAFGLEWFNKYVLTFGRIIAVGIFWFQGRVVDMLYFPLFSFTWPDWVPGVGGREFEFFQYIFNIADAAITVGVLLMLFFYSSEAGRVFKTLFGEEDDAKGKRSSAAK